MPKNIPGIVQRRKPRQEAPVQIRIQPPELPGPESMPPTPPQLSMTTNSAQCTGPVPPSMPPAPGMPQQLTPTAMPGMPPTGINEASPAPAYISFNRMGLLSGRSFAPAVPGGNNSPTLPSSMIANNLPTPPPPLPGHNLLTPLSSVNRSGASRPSLPMSEPLPPILPGPPGEAVDRQQSVRQGRPPLARILIEMNGKVNGEVLLQKPALTIGRLNSSDIYIASRRISRQHAQIFAEQNTWVIEDVGSVSGISYQGRHVKRLALKHGDRICLAPDVFLVYEASK